jgi:hypothetical protein
VEFGPLLRVMPRTVAGLPLVAASLCELRDGSLAVHLQFVAEERRVSVFLVARDVRLLGAPAGRFGGRAVRLVQAKGRLLGIVGDRVADLEAFVRALST